MSGTAATSARSHGGLISLSSTTKKLHSPELSVEDNVEDVGEDNIRLGINDVSNHKTLNRNHKWLPSTKVTSGFTSLQTSAPLNSARSQQTGAVTGSVQKSKLSGEQDCNQTSATSSDASSNAASTSQYQFQYQEEFNKMRERLFRVLSKVPIQVETISNNNNNNSTSFQEASCSSGGSGNSSNSSSTSKGCDREPLVIKYYNERSLSDILEIHFGCSMIKHNYERLLAFDAHCLTNESPSLPSVGPKYASCFDHSYPLATSETHIADNQQIYGYQQPDHQREQQSVYAAGWQQHNQVLPARQIASEGCNFQWQIQSYEALDQKAAAKLSGSCADFSQSSISSPHRRLAAAASIVMKADANHHSVKKPPLQAATTNGSSIGPHKTRQRRPAKQQQQLMARQSGGRGGGSNGSLDTSGSPISSISSGRTDMASPNHISAPIIYHAQQQQQNGKAKCYQSDEPTYAGEIHFANQLHLATTTTAFNPQGGSVSIDACHKHPAIYGTNNSHLSAIDHNTHNIQLHLYAPQTTAYPQQPASSMQPAPDTNNAGIILAADNGGSQVVGPLMTTQFNIQSSVDQQEPTAAAILFRHHPTMHHHTTSDCLNSGQPIQVYAEQLQQQHLNGEPLEQAQLLQHQQHHHDQLQPCTSAGQVQQYYTTNHPQAGNHYHQQQLSEPSDSVSNWRQSRPIRSNSELLNDEQPQQQQMIEQQQTNGIICDNYGRDRGFYVAPNNYSVLYANSRPHQVEPSPPQADMAQNGHHYQHT